jgi:hypothetical protein
MPALIAPVFPELAGNFSSMSPPGFEARAVLHLRPRLDIELHLAILLRWRSKAFRVRSAGSDSLKVVDLMLV